MNTEGCPVLPLADLEKREILRAIEYTKGDRTVAAALLGIGRTTLYRKLKEYGFDDGTSTALTCLSDALGSGSAARESHEPADVAPSRATIREILSPGG
jgi:hypothetical protein